MTVAESMTALEVIEQVREFFTRPGAKLSMTPSATLVNRGVCFYRHPDDPSVRCGVGCLIRDEEYEPDFEASTVTAIIHRLPIRLREHEDLLGDIQGAHDQSLNVSWFLNKLQQMEEDVIEEQRIDAETAQIDIAYEQERDA